MQPTACIAEFETAIASAPNAIAFEKSSATRKPPVMIKDTSFPTLLFKCFLALARAGMVGTEIWSRNINGAAPVPPPRPSKII